MHTNDELLERLLPCCTGNCNASEHTGGAVNGLLGAYRGEDIKADLATNGVGQAEVCKLGFECLHKLLPAGLPLVCGGAAGS